MQLKGYGASLQYRVFEAVHGMWVDHHEHTIIRYGDGRAGQTCDRVACHRLIHVYIPDTRNTVELGSYHQPIAQQMAREPKDTLLVLVFWRRRTYCWDFCTGCLGPLEYLFYEVIPFWSRHVTVRHISCGDSEFLC